MYEVGSATSAGKTIVLAMAFVARSMPTSFAPPGTTGANFTLPVSRTHSRFFASATTDWTETNVSFAREVSSLLICSLGYATALPPRTSATVYGTGSPQRGKFTKMRPFGATVTPVGIEPSKDATCSSVPTFFSAGSVAEAAGAPDPRAREVFSGASPAHKRNNTAGRAIIRALLVAA